MRMLDLFCGRFGWGKVFAARGWEVVGVDLVEPPEISSGCRFYAANILDLQWSSHVGMVHESDEDGLTELGHFDAICASSPCEQFSLFGLPHFHPNPPYPDLGIKLFNHARLLCESSGSLYIMENVKRAQDFVGRAVNHCGPFYVWGNSVPPILPQGIKKGVSMGSGSAMKGMTKEEKYLYRKQFDCLQVGEKSKARAEYTSKCCHHPPRACQLRSRVHGKASGDGGYRMKDYLDYVLQLRRGVYIARFRIRWHPRKIQQRLTMSFLDKLDGCSDDEARRLLLGIKRSEHAK